MSEQTSITWPELATSLFEKLVQQNAELCYEFDNMDIGVPSNTGSDASIAKWTLNGTIKISGRILK